MTTKEIKIQVKVTNEQQASHAEKALQTIADNFMIQELVMISKKIEMPLVKMKIKSML